MVGRTRCANAEPSSVRIGNSGADSAVSEIAARWTAGAGTPTGRTSDSNTVGGRVSSVADAGAGAAIDTVPSGIDGDGAGGARRARLRCRSGRLLALQCRRLGGAEGRDGRRLGREHRDYRGSGGTIRRRHLPLHRGCRLRARSTADPCRRTSGLQRRTETEWPAARRGSTPIPGPRRPGSAAPAVRRPVSRADSAPPLSAPSSMTRISSTKPSIGASRAASAPSPSRCRSRPAVPGRWGCARQRGCPSAAGRRPLEVHCSRGSVTVPTAADPTRIAAPQHLPRSARAPPERTSAAHRGRARAAPTAPGWRGRIRLRRGDDGAGRVRSGRCRRLHRGRRVDARRRQGRRHRRRRGTLHDARGFGTRRRRSRRHGRRSAHRQCELLVHLDRGRRTSPREADSALRWPPLRVRHGVTEQRSDHRARDLRRRSRDRRR